MKRGWMRIASASAFMAMVALAFAVPVHHVHMMQAALGAPVVGKPQHAVPAAHHDAHHHAHGHEHPDAHAAAAEPASGHSEDDHPGHEMPRCPLCSLANAAAAIAPSIQPSLSARASYRPAPPAVDSTAVPPRHHFRPVQPRAPPIVT